MTPGRPPSSMKAEHAVVNLFADHLHGNNDEFDDGGVGERGADGDLDGHMQEEDQQRSRDDSRAYAAQRDDNGDAKSDGKIHVDTTFRFDVLRGLQVICRTPVSVRPNVRSEGHWDRAEGCAGLTADA